MSAFVVRRTCRSNRRNPRIRHPTTDHAGMEKAQRVMFKPRSVDQASQGSRGAE